MPVGDPFNLGRFVEAQDRNGTYLRALDELRWGRKTTHWMWFVFPQLAGLGHSATSRHFAITSLAEAEAYLAHPVLGPRLHQCVGALLVTSDRTAEEILGVVDAQKLCSSLTLFHRAAPADSDFGLLLDGYFAGKPDSSTDRLLIQAAG